MLDLKTHGLLDGSGYTQAQSNGFATSAGSDAVWCCRCHRHETPEAASRVVIHFPELKQKLVASIPNGSIQTTSAGESANARTRISDRSYRVPLHGDWSQTPAEARIRGLLGGEPIPGVGILTRSHYFLLEANDLLLKREPTLAKVSNSISQAYSRKPIELQARLLWFI